MSEYSFLDTITKYWYHQHTRMKLNYSHFFSLKKLVNRHYTHANWINSFWNRLIANIRYHNFVSNVDIPVHRPEGKHMESCSQNSLWINGPSQNSQINTMVYTDFVTCTELHQYKHEWSLFVSCTTHSLKLYL